MLIINAGLNSKDIFCVNKKKKCTLNWFPRGLFFFLFMLHVCIYFCKTVLHGYICETLQLVLTIFFIFFATFER